MTVKKKRELFPGPPPASQGSFVLPPIFLIIFNFFFLINKKKIKCVFSLVFIDQQKIENRFYFVFFVLVLVQEY